MLIIEKLETTEKEKEKDSIITHSEIIFISHILILSKIEIMMTHFSKLNNANHLKKNNFCTNEGENTYGETYTHTHTPKKSPSYPKKITLYGRAWAC